MMNTLLKRRWWFAAALLLVLAGLLGGVNQAIVPDNALTVWFVESDPQLKAYRQFQSTFGNDEVVVVQLHEPRGVFRAEALERMRQAEARWSDIDGVAAVHSVLSVDKASPDGWTALVPQTLPEDLDPLRRQALAHPLVKERLLNEDATRALMIVQMSAMEDFDAQRDRIVAEVTSQADTVFAQQSHPMGGVGVIYSGLNEATQADFGLFMGLTYLLMIGMLMVVFRDWRLVLATLGVMTVGILVCLGVYGVMGHRINAVTVLLPTLVTVLGIADAVHFPVAWRRAQKSLGARAARRQIALKALRDAVGPCTLTTITTMIGFLALASSPMGVIQELGIYAAVGIGAALLASLVLMALVFMTAPIDRAPSLPAVDVLLSAAQRALVKRRVALTLTTLAVVFAAAWGAAQVKIDTNTLGYLPDSHRVSRDHKAIERGWGAYTPLDFVVSPGPGAQRVDDAQALAALDSFVARAGALPGIKAGLHYGDLYRYAAQAIPGRNPEDPLSQGEVLSLRPRLDDARKSAGPLKHYLNEEGSLGRLTLQGQMMSARQLDQTLQALDQIAQETLGQSVRLEPGGYPPLYVQIVDHVMASQIQGFAIALCLLFLVMWLGLRSLRLALISVLPNVFPVLVMMGVMGAAGIDLDIATATVGAIVLGVAVDDTVHFLYAWRQAEAEGLSWEDCLARTFDKAGRAAIVTTAILVVGFPVLMLASVTTVFAFGLLTTVAAIAALFGDLVLLPLLLRLWPARRVQ